MVVGSNPISGDYSFFFSIGSERTRRRRDGGIHTSGVTGVGRWMDARMAEWSKALDSRSSIYGCVGSNPTSRKYFFYVANVVKIAR